MNKILLIAFVTLLTAIASQNPAARAQLPCDMPDAIAVMHGLKAVALRSSATDDATKALKSVGQSTSKIKKLMTDVARERLSDIGIDVTEDNPKDLGLGHAELLYTIYTDLYSGTVKIALRLNELVTLERTPETKVIVTTWEKSGNPRSNEGKPMADTASALVELFIADYLEANPRGRHKS